jgi:hypothetical protein
VLFEALSRCWVDSIRVVRCSYDANELLTGQKALPVFEEAFDHLSLVVMTWIDVAAIRQETVHLIYKNNAWGN